MGKIFFGILAALCVLAYLFFSGFIGYSMWIHHTSMGPDNPDNIVVGVVLMLIFLAAAIVVGRYIVFDNTSNYGD